MVSACPGGQALLICERVSGPFLYWTVSVPHLATRSERIVANQGPVPPEFNVSFTKFHIHNNYYTYI